MDAQLIRGEGSRRVPEPGPAGPLATLLRGDTGSNGAARGGGLRPVMDLLAAIRYGRLGDDMWLIAFTHYGDPASKARARWSSKSHRTYTPAKTVAAQELLEEAFRKALNGQRLEGNVAIAAVFYRPNHQRIDADNLMKLVLDAATKAGVWIDDSQVTAQASVVELDAELPRTIVAIGPTASTLNRGELTQVCPRCGKRFRVVRSIKPRKYCSRSCAQPTSVARCARCGEPFKRRSAGQRYCSRTCAQRDPLHRQAIASSRPHPTCANCGGRVSRREYLRCSNCTPKGRRRGSKNRSTIAMELGL